jgi:predicted transcriptional regulator
MSKEQVAAIVSAYVGHNAVSADQLPALIASVSEALSSLGGQPPPTPLTPAVPIRRSVSTNAIICLDCGWSGMMLRRHLSTAHDMSVDGYRSRWNLPHDFPLVAKGYSARRSEMAKAMGLGKARQSRRRRRPPGL